MSVLSDRAISDAMVNDGLVIDPFDVNLLQPASLDIRLSPTILRYDPPMRISDSIDPYITKVLMSTFKIHDHYLLEPKEFVLGSSVERIEMPSSLVGRIEGKSSLGRLGYSCM